MYSIYLSLPTTFLTSSSRIELVRINDSETLLLPIVGNLLSLPKLSVLRLWSAARFGKLTRNEYH